MKRIIPAALFAALLLSVYTGCNNNPNSDGKILSSEKKLTAFNFKTELNALSGPTIVGRIDEDAKTVSVTIPVNEYKTSTSANKKFKPSFTVSPDAKLYIGGKEQKSGITEDLFIYDREYRVVAEDRSSQTYRLHIKIDYNDNSLKPELQNEVKKFYGTYEGTLPFEKWPYKMCVVFDKEKSFSFSNPMSAVYSNMRWEKISDTQWKCKTYHKKDFERKNVSNEATFTVKTDGTITCKIIVHPMKSVKSNDMPKVKENYIFSPEDGNGFAKPKEY